MQIFEVGGCVRDEIMGRKTKDIDFSVVLDPGDIVPRRTKAGKMVDDHPFDIMESILRKRGFTIFQSNRKFLTSRARFPRFTNPDATIGRDYKNLTADFVLARKDGEYTDSRRPDYVEIGTLHDDLARRDFCMNAIAKATDGTIIDPFGGAADIAGGLISTVGDPWARISEDPLRALRALRFAITLGFTIDGPLAVVLRSNNMTPMIAGVARERVREEMEKMFRHNTYESMKMLNEFRAIREGAFGSGTIWLLPTMKER